MPVEMMDALRGRANKAIASNAAILEKTPPEKQWWNLAAKYEAAKRIKGEMLRVPGHNNAGDAFRHAELSRRLADEIDPLTSYVAGVTHEIDNSIPASWVPSAPDPASRLAPMLEPLHRHAMQNWHGQGLPETMMDLRNNAEGRRAASEGRVVDVHRLQLGRDAAPPTGAPYVTRR